MLRTEQPTNGQLINGLIVGKFTKIDKIIPAGSLEARKLTSGGVMFYWRVTANGKTKREPLGPYDPRASPKSHERSDKGFSVQAAKFAAQALASAHHANLDNGGYHALKMQKLASRAAKEVAAQAMRDHSFGDLMADYADYIQALGRQSHSDVRSITKLHIMQSWPKIVVLPANQITGEQIADMMRKVMEAGKARTANKLRSYVRAAFQTAKVSRTKANIPAKFKGYAVAHNPAADTEPDESANRADKRPLNGEELRTYWKAIKPLPGLRGAVLRFHLLTGGQRIQQLVSLRTADIGDGVITLFDGKGRPGKAPRPHTVPLVPAAAIALQGCHPEGVFALSSNQGKTHISATTLSNWAVEAAPSSLVDFQTKRIRSGVETLLASLRVSTDTRGRLQSHGISGVQARHYDGHDYIDEKREALKALFAYLESGNSTTVNATKISSQALIGHQ